MLSVKGSAIQQPKVLPISNQKLGDAPCVGVCRRNGAVEPGSLPRRYHRLLLLELLVHSLPLHKEETMFPYLRFKYQCINYFKHVQVINCCGLHTLCHPSSLSFSLPSLLLPLSPLLSLPLSLPPSVTPPLSLILCPPLFSSLSHPSSLSHSLSPLSSPLSPCQIAQQSEGICLHVISLVLQRQVSTFN